MLIALEKNLGEMDQRVDQLVSRLPELKTNQGISLLEVRMHGLLSYLCDLSFLSLLKVSGSSIKHPVVDRLIEWRTILEKTKPLETKLKYQIDKLVKAAIMHDDEEQMAQEEENILMYKPNPENLIAPDADEEQQEKDVYKPPKVAPLHYDPHDTKKKGRLTERLKERASKSRLLRDLQSEYDDRPEDLDVGGTGYSAKEVGASKEDEEWKERVAFEEENMIRRNLTRKDKKMVRMLEQQGWLHRFKNDFKDLHNDFAELSGLHRAVEEDEAAKYGKGVTAKRARRSEQFKGALDSKRAKYGDAAEMITHLSKAKKSQTKDGFSRDKRILKKASRR